VTQEVEADYGGVLLKIELASGEAPVGQTIAWIGDAGEEIKAAAKPAAAAPQAAAGPKLVPTPAPRAAAKPAASATAPAATPKPAATAKPAAKAAAGPASDGATGRSR